MDLEGYIVRDGRAEAWWQEQMRTPVSNHKQEAESKNGIGLLEP